ncbi:hypothetical protein ACQJBY_071964 [Aegilops geniculata]
MNNLWKRVIPLKIQIQMMRMEKLQAMMVKALFASGGFYLMRQRVFSYKGCCLSVMISSGFPFVHRLTRTDNCLGMMAQHLSRGHPTALFELRHIEKTGEEGSRITGAATSKVSAAGLAGDEMLGDARGEMLGDPSAPPESPRPADEIEREIETKTKSSLKEGLGQQLKIVRTRSFFCVFDLTPSFLHSLFWISSSFYFFSHMII